MVFPSTRCPVFCCSAEFRTRCPFTLHIFVPVNRFRPRSRVARSRSRVARSRYTFSSPLTVFAFPSTRCPVFCCFAQFHTRCPFTLHVSSRVTVLVFPSTRSQFSAVPQSSARVARSRYTFSSPLTVFALPSTRCPVFCCFAQFRTCCPFTFTCCPFTCYPFTLHVFVPVNRFRVSIHALPRFVLFRTVPHVLPVHVTPFRPC